MLHPFAPPVLKSLADGDMLGGPKTNESMARIWLWKSAETLFLALETKL